MSATVDYKVLYEQSQLQVIELKRQLDQLKKMIFGSRAERFVPTDPATPQLNLGLQAEAVAEATITSSHQINYTRHVVRKEEKPVAHPGRMKLPESLRREVIVIEPAVDTTDFKRIDEEITEVLDYQPGELYVKQYRRPKYARPGGEGVVIGQLPSRPLEKAMAGEGLLAQVVIDKYVDHLPLYRQMQRFERAGIKLAYSTLSDWVSGTCRLIEPLFGALKAELLQSQYLHADETPIRVMDKDKKGETHRGYYWVYQNSLDKLVLFDYREGRSREGPAEILKDFTGYLQTDGYAAYDAFAERPGITLLHCMAHARRMFHEALDNDRAVAEHALEKIRQLYAIERSCREGKLEVDRVREVRQEQSVPILLELGIWMKQKYMEALPKSAIGKALGYSLERWERLSRYTEDGRLHIDNNPVENSIRPVAVGRKNYLFAGSHEAAKRAGMLYSLLGTCKLHGLEPYGWLRDVLHIIAEHPVNRIAELLPHRYKK